jgi:uridine kinase
LQYYILN